MEIKYNEATHNRPMGDRIIDAPIVLIDLEKYSQQLTEEDAWEKNGRNGITKLILDSIVKKYHSFQDGIFFNQDHLMIRMPFL